MLHSLKKNNNNKKQEQTSFAEDWSTKLVRFEGWENSFLLLYLVPGSFISFGGKFLWSLPLGKESGTGSKRVLCDRETMRSRLEEEGTGVN